MRFMTTALTAARHWRLSLARSVGVFSRDVGNGLLELSHNSLALVGLAAVALAVFAGTHAELRQQAEGVALDWLKLRYEQRESAAGNLLASAAEPDAVARATATDPRDLPRQQAVVAQWLAKRYKVAPEPISALVQEAWAIGRRAELDPTLILAVMAIESRFNPFAQSAVGAQGLMQVMTRVHDDKYESFGGNHAAFDPISNLRVGVQVLKDCIQRAGSLQEGLRFYVGAALLDGDNGYAARVLSEQGHLRQVAAGKTVPVNAANAAPSPVPNPATQVQFRSLEAGPQKPAGAAPEADAAVSRAEQLAWLSPRR